MESSLGWLLIFGMLHPTLLPVTVKNHSVTLRWKASPDGGTVGVHRAAGGCGSGTLRYTLLTTTAPVAGPYVDRVSSGQYCYYVDARVNSGISGPSNTAGVTVRR